MSPGAEARLHGPQSRQTTSPLPKQERRRGVLCAALAACCATKVAPRKWSATNILEPGLFSSATSYSFNVLQRAKIFSVDEIEREWHLFAPTQAEQDAYEAEERMQFVSHNLAAEIRQHFGITT